MNFEEVIRNILIHENDFYIKENNERLFKVHRRCSKRLHLICRYDDCKFLIRCSIIRGNIKTSEKIRFIVVNYCFAPENRWRIPVTNATACGGSMESIAVSFIVRKLPRSFVT